MRCRDRNLLMACVGIGCSVQTRLGYQVTKPTDSISGRDTGSLISIRHKISRLIRRLGWLQTPILVITSRRTNIQLVAYTATFETSQLRLDHNLRGVHCMTVRAMLDSSDTGELAT